MLEPQKSEFFSSALPPEVLERRRAQSAIGRTISAEAHRPVLDPPPHAGGEAAPGGRLASGAMRNISFMHSHDKSRLPQKARSQKTIQRLT